MAAKAFVKGVAPAAPFFNVVGRTVALLTSLMLSALVVLVTLEVLLRAALGYSLGFVEEVTGYLVVGLTLFGAAMAVRAQSLFQVRVLFDAFPNEFKRVLGSLFAVLAIAICAILAWKTYELVGSSFSRGKFAPTVLRTPLWVPQLLLPLGFVTIAVFILEHLLILLRSKQGE
ncbi:TRAP transporter small permease [Marinomonas ostreistagni]|uniref:TRAP transporter small permease n=1 Tax=Marinomonas ostreistagni TaxID=359209 RepID=UPI001951570F|nr:TRAP transporter small permease [Marinomonas ostreistagni]MBM6550085.1 TRAP transporter small permease [Marinomonas ostreistagni]